MGEEVALPDQFRYSCNQESQSHSNHATLISLKIKILKHSLVDNVHCSCFPCPVMAKEWSYLVFVEVKIESVHCQFFVGCILFLQVANSHSNLLVPGLCFNCIGVWKQTKTSSNIRYTLWRRKIIRSLNMLIAKTESKPVTNGYSLRTKSNYRRTLPPAVERPDGQHGRAVWPPPANSFTVVCSDQYFLPNIPVPETRQL